MSDQPRTHPSETAPGCGFASYGLVLLFGFLMGVVGMVSSSLTLIQAGSKTGPSDLVPGTQVAVWRLQPMRDAGLLDLTEVPLAYHNETLDGTTACALTQTQILRVEAPQGWRIDYTDIVGVDVVQTNTHTRVSVATDSDDGFSCHFGPNEGANRLAHMIRAEAGLPLE